MFFVNTTIISHSFVLTLTFTSHKLPIKFRLLTVPLLAFDVSFGSVFILCAGAGKLE